MRTVAIKKCMITNVQDFMQAAGRQRKVGDSAFYRHLFYQVFFTFATTFYLLYTEQKIMEEHR